MPEYTEAEKETWFRNGWWKAQDIIIRQGTRYPITRKGKIDGKVFLAEERSEKTIVINPEGFKPGDLYEDCDYRPMLCTRVNGNDIYGLSLIDGVPDCACSITHCGIRKITLEEALELKTKYKKPQ